MKLFATLFLSVTLWAAGCPTTESVAVKSLAANKGFVESEMGKHGDCKPGVGITTSDPKLCTLLNDAIAAQHVGVLALDSYCASEDYLTKGGQCSPPANLKTDLQAKLQTAVKHLEDIVGSIKTITNGGKQ